MTDKEVISYVEFPSQDLQASKAFFETVFKWKFVDYGPDYASFSGAGLNGGFYRSSLSATTENGSALIVLYSKDLEKTQQRIEQAGGNIIKPVFSFPGGRRFHFCDPAGNEYAVWSEK